MTETMTDKEKMLFAKAILYKQQYEEQKAARHAATRNDIYSIMRNFPGRYVVLIGGSGSGKSYEIADHILDRITEEPKSRPLAVRAQRNQVSESQFPLLRSRVKTCFDPGKFHMPESKGAERIVYKPNESEILFAGLDKQHCPV